MARFDKSMAESQKAKQSPQLNGHAPSSPEGSAPPFETPKSDSPAVTKKPKHESDEELSDVIDSPQPKKKRKVEQDSDAAYAAKLQAMENSRMRSTRGGGAKTPKPVKRKTPKKKSAGRVKAEDDSDMEASGSDVKERKINRNTGFHVSCKAQIIPCTRANPQQKELLLSAPLSQLLNNEVKVSRLASSGKPSLTTAAITASDGQKDLGICARTWAARPERQAMDHLR